MHTYLMTIFIQYNVNNHILDGACYIWWPSVFPGGEFVSVLSKHYFAEFRTPLYNPGYVW